MPHGDPCTRISKDGTGFCWRALGQGSQLRTTLETFGNIWDIFVVTTGRGTLLVSCGWRSHMTLNAMHRTTDIGWDGSAKVEKLFSRYRGLIKSWGNSWPWVFMSRASLIGRHSSYNYLLALELLFGETWSKGHHCSPRWLLKHLGLVNCSDSTNNNHLWNRLPWDQGQDWGGQCQEYGLLKTAHNIWIWEETNFSLRCSRWRQEWEFRNEGVCCPVGGLGAWSMQWLNWA